MALCSAASTLITVKMVVPTSGSLLLMMGINGEVLDVLIALVAFYFGHVFFYLLLLVFFADE